MDEEVRDAPGEAPAEATTDFEVRSLRVPREETFVVIGEAEDTPIDRNQDFILNEEDAAALRFDVEHEDTDKVRSFVEATDFENASVVVHQRTIDDCYERHVEYVIAQPDRYRVQLCRELREATTPCSADRTEMEALFIRIPRAYESRPSQRGGGERAGCHGGGVSAATTGSEGER